MPDDEGFVFAMGSCCSCGTVFSFNPHKVPSIWINGVKEPICETCIKAANVERQKLNLPPHQIHPDAYNPMPAGEL